MAVAVSSRTVVSPLWEVPDASASSATVTVRQDGVFLSFQLGRDGAGGSQHDVTFVAFHPVDETCFVFGTAHGKAFGVSLQDNKLFLLADLGRGALRCGTFCPGYLTSPIVIIARSTNRLVFVDWQRGTVVREIAAVRHTQPIVRLVTGPSTEAFFCAVSADAVTCWEPALPSPDAAGGGGLDGAISNSMPASGGAAQAVAPRAASASEQKGGSSRAGHASFAASRYTCIGSTGPTSSPLPLLREDTSEKGDRQASTPRFVNVHVLSPVLLLSVETSNQLSVWIRGAEGRSGGGDHGIGVGTAQALREQAGQSSVADKAVTSAMRLLKSALAPSTLRVRCSALCGPLIALGADAVTASAHGAAVEPVVAFIDAESLTGAGVVRLPTNGSAAAAAGKAAGAATVVQVQALQSDLVACVLSTGVVHVVLASTYHLVFTIHAPFAGGEALSSLPAEKQRARWCFTPSGPTFGAMFRGEALHLLHLPSIRRAHAACPQPAGHAATATAPPRRQQAGAPSGSRRASSIHVDATLSSRGVDASPVTAVAHPFLRNRVSTRGTSSLAESRGDVSLTQSSFMAPDEVAAALAVLAARRPPANVPRKGFPGHWVDVNLVDLRFSDAGGVRMGSDGAQATEADADTTAHKAAARAMDLWADARLCDSLSPTSCQYNLEQLQRHLLRHGVFPHLYRPQVWRFLLGLPSKAKTAPQYAAVARRPAHVAVGQLMEPFPLPHPKTRQAVEEALSCLCWVAPVLALASYLPVLVYPLVMLFRDDVQTVVETVLVFFSNWGADFFTCHPAGPPLLMTWMDRELARLDPALHQHLEAVGAGVAVWGWELLLSFYTDVLTGAEWLQVMDHALLANPLWLFAFHVTLVRTRLHAPLMAAVSADEVRRALRFTSGVSAVPASAADSSTAAASSPHQTLKTILEDAYRLQDEWVRRCESGDTSGLEAYTRLTTLPPSFEYPSAFAHDPVVLSEKMRELGLVQRRQQEMREAEQRRDALRQEAESTAAREALFLQQQRARVAAKYDVSSTAWQVQVALEEERQRQAAQERQLRYEMLQARTRNAEEVMALHAEMNTVEAQLRHDMVDRHMEQLKWGLATHITDGEIARMQQEAMQQVERAVQHLEDDAAQQAEEMARFHAEPVLQVETAREPEPEAPDAEQDGDMEKDGHSDMSSNRSVHQHMEMEEVEEVVENTSRSITGSDDHNPYQGEAAPSAERHSTPRPSRHSLTDQAPAALPSTPPAELASTRHRRQEGESPASECDAAAEPPHNQADHTTVSDATEMYATPSKEHTSRERRVAPPPRRHRSPHASVGSSVTDPSRQSFVELRNRVLQRLQPVHANSAADQNAKPARRPQNAVESSASTEENPFSSSAYYSYSYDSRASSAREGTTTVTTSSASTGHQRADTHPPRDQRGKVAGTLSHPSYKEGKGVTEGQRHANSSAVATSALPTTSNTGSYTWSYYDYSTGRSSASRSTGSSLPSTSKSRSQSTTQQ